MKALKAIHEALVGVTITGVVVATFFGIGNYVFPSDVAAYFSLWAGVGAAVSVILVVILAGILQHAKRR